jgi:hypothetical protein
MNWIKPIFLSFFKAPRVKHSLTSNKKIKPSFSLEALEPKILLSAELVGGVIDGSAYIADDAMDSFSSQIEFDQWANQLAGKVNSNLTDNTQATVSTTSDLTFNSLESLLSDQSIQSDTDGLDQLLADSALQASSFNNQSLELIIIDPRTPDYLELVTGVSTESDSNYLIYVLDPDLDGVQQVTDLLASHSDLSAVHIVSHGSEGSLQLGTSWLSSDNLDQYTDQISTWQSVFDDDADILIYGCDLAGNISGVELINSLAELTGADVSASDDATGLAELGGDWELEYQTGNIETQIAFNQEVQNTWQNTLVIESDLWISIDGTGGGSSGFANNSNILSLSDSSLTLELGDGDVDGDKTDATFSYPYTMPGNVSAMHYVSQDVTVDTFVGGVEGSYDLKVGQIVLSMTSSNEEGVSVNLLGGGTLFVNSTDLLVYTPSLGAYELLLEDAIFESDDSTIADIYAVSIIESDTTIGADTKLTAGTYLIARSDATIQSDISTYNNVTGLQKLLSGSDYLDDAEEHIQGLEFIESDITIGGQTLSEGQILVTVTTNKANPVGGFDDPITIGTEVGSGSVEASQKDIVVLTVNGTEQDTSQITDIDAQILFDASDIGLLILDDSFTPTGVNALSLFATTIIPEASNLTQNVYYTEGADSVALDDIVITGIDSSEMVTATLTLADVQAGVLNTGTFGDATSTYNSDSGIWTVTGTVTDVNEALADVAFTPNTNYDTNTTITTHIEDSTIVGPEDGIISLNVTAVNELLLLSTTGDVNSPSGVSGLDSWDDSTVFGFAPEDNGLGTTTIGEFSELFDLSLFTNGGNVDALHYVTQDVSVGTGTAINLFVGDVLFSIGNDKTLTSSDLSTLDINKEDIIIFRPDVVGDYSAGTFSLLFTNPSGDDISAISLAEEDTLVGDTIIKAGSFLFAEESSSIYVFTPEDLTLSATDGTVQMLVDGEEESSNDGDDDDDDDDDDEIFQDKIIGIELVENEYTIAGTILKAGTILITTDGDKGIWLDNEQSGTRQDIYALDLTQTTLTSGSSAGTVSIFFDGSDVGLDSNNASIDALSFVEPALVVNSAPTGNVAITGTLTEDQTLTADISAIDDVDGLGTFEYQWLRDGNFINEATSSTYILDEIDIGTSISVFVNYTDGNSNLEILTSAETASIANINDAPTATNLTQIQSYTESESSIAFDDIVISDADSGETVSATLTLTNVNTGVLTTGTFGVTTSSYDSVTGVWFVTGTVADVNTALAAVTFVPYTNNDVDTTITSHIEDAGGAGPIDGVISLNVSATNDVPTAINLNQVQTYTESASSVVLDDIVISDVDTGETVSATLTLTNATTGLLTTGTFGSAISSYNSGTGIWSVTGSVADVNAALADVTFVPTTNNDINTSLTSHIEDSTGAGPTDGSITLTVTALNDDPTLDNNIPDQTVDEASLLNFTFDANTFSDVDTGDSLSYSAQLVGGGTLPSWLNFNASTRTFSGTPLNENVGTLSVEVIADDGQGGTPATDSFDIVVSNVNDNPTQENSISNQDAIEDVLFTFTFAENTFNDIDSGDSLTYSAQLVGGATLPTWLNFDSSTRTFSGTPANDDVGLLSIEVIADDGQAGTTATTTFNLVIANSNDAPTGAITINGNAIEYQTLTINASMLSDDDGLGVFSYQWLRDSNAISGAIYNSYALDNADVGSVISYQVNYTDGRGSYETVTSPETATIANINDLPTGNVSITGTATVGSTLTASNNLDDDDGLGPISYQWQRNGVDITGATASTYTITVIDDNQTLNVVASYTDLNSTLETVYSAATATVTGTNYTPTGSVDIFGLAQEGETLTTDTSTLADADGLGTFSYQWQRDGVNISGATSSSYVLDNDDVDHAITVVVSYLDSGLPVGTTESVSSDATALVINVNGVASATEMNQSKNYIEGDVNVALNDIVVSDADIDDIITATLTLDDVSAGVLTTGTFGFATSTYDTGTGVWTVTGTVVDVNSALADTAFAPSTNNDINTSITTHIEDALATGPADGVIYLLVNAMNDDPTLDNAIADQLATEDSFFSFTFGSDTFNDVDTGISLNYTAQLVSGGSLPDWLSFNNSTRTFSGTPLNDDVGIINIKVFASDGQGSPMVSDSFTITISNTNDVPSGNVTIIGTATEDQLLTADTSSIYDQDGIGTFSYQWLRDGVDISGQTNNTFTLGDEDVGSQITVEVSYTDARGSNENISSLATTPVLNINDAPIASNQTQIKSYTEGDSSVAFDDIVVTDLDDSETISATLVLSEPTSGSLSTGIFGSSSSNYNNATGVWTVSGSLIDVNAALANVEFLPTTNNDINVTVTTHIEDAGGAGPSDGIISLNVNALNDDPTLNNAIADQNATEDNAFSFTFDADTFVDVDSDAALTYSAQLSDGSALPSWLSFDAITRTFSGTPLNLDVGMISIEVTADDGLGGTPATDSFDLLVANTNDDPVVNNAIVNQNATEDSFFSFTFDADTFTDVDTGSVLTYSAQLADGSALPSWLSFDANTRTFSGTPANADVGSLSIEVIADDGLGDTPAIDSFDLLVANTNDDPVVNNAIADQNATEDSLFGFTFDADTFTDVDAGSVLTYSAQLADGSALPSWLSFDANTRTFSGTPANADVGSLSIEVIADDGLGGIPATDSFDFLVTNTNDDPVVNNAIADQNATEDSLFSFTFDADIFTDVDAGSVLTYSAQLTDGSALPSWLSFDANTRTFSGTPLNADVGSLSIEVIADDGLGGNPATDSFDLLVTNTNDDPVVNNAIADQNATEDSFFGFTFDADTFTDVDTGSVLTYSAQLTDGSALPTWLSFDANTRTFTGTPLNTDVGSLSIEVSADDSQDGTVATDNFELVIANINDDPTLNNAIADQNATEDSFFSFTFDANSFTDVDSDAVLTYSAQLADGSVLPSWLSFDAITRTFSGTPLNSDVGAISIKVTANDGLGGLTATDSFELLITDYNNPPTLNSEIEDQIATEDSNFSFTFDANTFVDLDSGDTITYSAQLADGSSLPSWLSFDALTRTFSGTPLNDDVGSLSIKVTANDSLGGSPATDSFELVIANTNDDPILNNAIANQNATEDSTFSFTFDANTFTDVDSDAVLTYSAQLTDGSVLPSWLSFDATSRTFSGVPLNADVGSLSITVSADDGQGGMFAIDSFELAIANKNDFVSGSVTITGSLLAGEVLTADTSIISDEDGLGEFSFQWQKGGSDILGATASSYVLQESDLGANISVKVSYIDTRGTFESINSLSLEVPFEEVDIIDDIEEEASVIFTPVIVNISEEVEPEEETDVVEEISEVQEESEREASNEENALLLEQTLVFETDENQINALVIERNDKPSIVVKAELENILEEKQGVLKDNYLAYEDPLLLLKTNSFLRELDDIRQDLNRDVDFNKAVVGSSLFVSAGISAGYVAWLARSGVLLSSVLSTLPMWRFVDPLPILNQTGGALDEDDESLESIVEDGKVADGSEASDSDQDAKK